MEGISMVVREWLYIRAGARLIAERDTVCPESDVHEVGTWIRQQYGPSIDASWLATPDGSNRLVGWIFHAPAAWAEDAGVDAAAVELVAVPMWTDVDGRPAGPAYLRLGGGTNLSVGDEAA
jgi:hypothetical protein